MHAVHITAAMSALSITCCYCINMADLVLTQTMLHGSPRT